MKKALNIHHTSLFLCDEGIDREMLKKKITNENKYSIVLDENIFIEFCKFENRKNFDELIKKSLGNTHIFLIIDMDLTKFYNIGGDSLLYKFVSELEHKYAVYPVVLRSNFKGFVRMNHQTIHTIGSFSIDPMEVWKNSILI